MRKKREEKPKQLVIFDWDDTLVPGNKCMFDLGSQELNASDQSQLLLFPGAKESLKELYPHFQVIVLSRKGKENARRAQILTEEGIPCVCQEPGSDFKLIEGTVIFADFEGYCDKIMEQQEAAGQEVVQPFKAEYIESIEKQTGCSTAIIIDDSSQEIKQIKNPNTRWVQVDHTERGPKQAQNFFEKLPRVLDLYQLEDKIRGESKAAKVGFFHKYSSRLEMANSVNQLAVGALSKPNSTVEDLGKDIEEYTGMVSKKVNQKEAHKMHLPELTTIGEQCSQSNIVISQRLES